MKFLIIDDSSEDRELIMWILQRKFSSARFVQVTQQNNFDGAIARCDFDVVITEYRLDWTDGLWILKTIRGRFPYIPVVMVTNVRGEGVAVEGMKSGLSDFILKKHLYRLPDVVKEGLEKSRILRMHAEADQKYRMLMDNASDAISLLDIEGNLLEVNKKAEELTGYTKEELMHMNFARLHPEEEIGKVVTAFKEGILKGLLSWSRVSLYSAGNRQINRYL